MELDRLADAGFDSSLVKVAPNCHIVKDEHIFYDKKNLASKLGTTSRGIAPCYSSKAARTGLLAKDVLEYEFIWDGELSGNILCEGAQGVWLDINHGNYPYVTSSNTLPYGACSLGFPPQFIRHIYGATKIYDTRSGIDPFFPENLLEDKDLLSLVKVGEEFGTTTGRMRKTNWLNLDKLVDAIRISGTTIILISKIDVIKNLNKYKLYHNSTLIDFENFDSMKTYIDKNLKENCPLLENITYSEKNELK